MLARPAQRRLDQAWTYPGRQRSKLPLDDRLLAGLVPLRRVPVYHPPPIRPKCLRNHRRAAHPTTSESVEAAISWLHHTGRHDEGQEQQHPEREVGQWQRVCSPPAADGPFEGDVRGEERDVVPAGAPPGRQARSAAHAQDVRAWACSRTAEAAPPEQRRSATARDLKGERENHRRERRPMGRRRGRSAVAHVSVTRGWTTPPSTSEQAQKAT